MSVSLRIDGREVSVPAGSTIWEAAQSLEIDIPTLCHDPALAPVGVCRICVVEIEGARTLAASCVRRVEPGMEVRTTSAKLERCRGMLTELLMSEQPESSPKERTTADDALFSLARRLDVPQRLPRAAGRPIDDIPVGHARGRDISARRRRE